MEEMVGGSTVWTSERVPVAGAGLFGSSPLRPGGVTTCQYIFGRACPTPRELIFTVFFTGPGVMVVTILAVVLLIVFRTFGPPEVDERAEEIGRMWEEHERRFPSKSRRLMEERLAAEVEVKEGKGEVAAPAVEKACSKTLPQKVHREIYVPTVPGPTRVTIWEDEDLVGCGGDDSAAGVRAIGVPILTMHDACHNSRTCFGAVSQAAAADPMLSRSIIYHVDMPGHEEGGTDIGAATFSLEGQASQLGAVVAALELDRFLGIGVGAGANVLLRYASSNPSQVAGLYLVSPVVNAPDWRERNMWRWVQTQLWMSSGSDRVGSNAASSVAEWAFDGGSRSAAARCERQLTSMHAPTLSKYVQACLDRDALDDNRLGDLRATPISIAFSRGSWGSWAGSLVTVMSGVDHSMAATQLFKSLRGRAVLVELERGGRIPTEACTPEALKSIKELLDRAQ